MPKQEPDVSINLRLPGELHAELRETAQTEQRSLNAQIIYMLRRSLAAAK
jgi:hypothetical protein